jgi:uncharacterized protein (TIGR03435 family)
MTRTGAACILAVTVVAGSGAFAVRQHEPAFEVASVRALPSSPGLPPGFAMNPRRTGDRLTWTTSIYDLTLYAFNLPAWRVSGIQRDAYIAITAKVDPAATPDAIRPMLRQLLIDRFGLVTHTRTERRSGFTLGVEKNGPKNLETTKADGSVPPMPAYMSGQPPGPFEGFIFTGAADGCCHMTGRGVPMSSLAEELSSQIEAFVIDQTGLKGRYYFGFAFRRHNHVDPDAVDAPVVFDAVEDELGLTLNTTIGPVEFLVVDRVEKVPTEN